jgi:Arc/MetJ-type ribon-helix-helix transcriptional regulator
MSRPLPSEPTATVTMRFGESMVAAIDRVATEMQLATTARVSRSEVVRRLLAEALALRALAAEGIEAMRAEISATTER